MNDRTQQKFEQVRQMLAGRFGKAFEFRRLGQVFDEDLDVEYTEKNGDLLIPLRINRAYLGTAVIIDGANMTREAHQQICQLVRLVLEPDLYSSFLERAEGNIQAEVNPARESLPNIRELANGSLNPTRAVLTSNLVYFRGHDVQRTRKSGMLLHELTGRWAFVPWTDIEADISSVEDLRRLGAVTLFCHDILSVKEKHQEILSAFSKPQKSEDEPLVIIGGGWSITALKARAREFNGNFLEALVKNSLDLDRTPLSESGLREVLEIMYLRHDG